MLSLATKFPAVNDKSLMEKVIGMIRIANASVSLSDTGTLKPENEVIGKDEIFDNDNRQTERVHSSLKQTVAAIFLRTNEKRKTWRLYRKDMKVY